MLVALRGKSVSIGVEVSDTSVRVAELEWAKGPRLRRLETYELDGEPGSNSSDLDLAAWQGVWQRVFPPSGRKKRKLHVAVPNRWTVIRQLGLPDFSDEELRSVIEFQLQHNIHLPFDEVTFDFVRCPREEAAGEAGTDAETSLILVAADKQLVAPLVESLRHSGVRPISVDIHPLAVYRLLRRFHGGLPQTFLFMEVNGDVADMHVFHQGLLYLTRQFPLPVPATDVSAGMFDNLNQIGVEIERTMNFFRYSLNQRGVEFAQLLIAVPEGATSEWSALEGQLGIPCEIMSLSSLIRSHVSFSRKVTIRPDDPFLHDYAAAIGLALREV